MDEYDLTVDKGSSDQIITNLGHISNKNNKYTIPISVTNETGTSTKIYTLNITLPHSSKMKKLTLTSDGGTKLEYDVPIDETTMDINLESHIAAVHATTELYDSEAKSNVLGDGYIQDDEYTITITVTEPHVSSTVYTINIKRITVSGYEKMYLIQEVIKQLLYLMIMNIFYKHGVHKVVITVAVEVTHMVQHI